MRISRKHVHRISDKQEVKIHVTFDCIGIRVHRRTYKKYCPLKLRFNELLETTQMFVAPRANFIQGMGRAFTVMASTNFFRRFLPGISPTVNELI